MELNACVCGCIYMYIYRKGGEYPIKRETFTLWTLRREPVWEFEKSREHSYAGAKWTRQRARSQIWAGRQ